MIIANVALNAEWVRDLPRHDIEVLARLAEEKHFEPFEVLFHHGELADRFYMIVSGTVALTLPWKANSFIVQTIIAREDIGWDALLDAGVRRFTAKALTPVQALAFNGPELCAECERNPEFGFRLMKHLLHVVSERLSASRLQLLIRSEGISPRA
jgi:CRP/FNR family cyclic AMP-dependent transcriptional regulator